MSFKNVKRLFVLGLSSLILLCSCGTKTAKDWELVTDANKDSVKYTVAKTWDYEEADKIYFDILGEDVMPIVGYWGPYKETMYKGAEIPSLRTDEMWQLVKDTGVNLVTQNNDAYSDSKETLLQTLDFAEKYGLGYFMKDNELFILQRGTKDASGFFTDGSSVFGTQEDFNERIKEYVNHKGFAGLDFVDEPSWSMLKDGKNSNIGKVTDMYFKALEANGAANKYPWLNLFPAGMVTKEGGNYTEYLKSTAEILGYISYDAYPFFHDRKDDLNTSHLYGNLGQVYDAARESGVPFWAFVQCGGNWDTFDEHTSCKPPLLEQTLWETNLFIAYGAKGIQYYTMCMPHSNFPYIEHGGETGMFDMFGNKTKYFHAAQIANTQINACSATLMNSTQHGLIAKGEMPGETRASDLRSYIADGKFRELTEVDSGDTSALIGCFDHKGKTMLWVMNNSYYDNAQVFLTFDGRYCFDVVQRGERVKIVGNKFDLKLSAGEAAMVELN